MMKEKIDEFKKVVPVAIALRKKGMKDRHWDALTQKVGFAIKPYEGFTYGKCMEMNLLEHTEAIVDIGERSGKEF
jgi:dynein heavy chain